MITNNLLSNQSIMENQIGKNLENKDEAPAFVVPAGTYELSTSQWGEKDAEINATAIELSGDGEKDIAMLKEKFPEDGFLYVFGRKGFDERDNFYEVSLLSPDAEKWGEKETISDGSSLYENAIILNKKK